jgi:hypothetical protein
LVCWRALHCAEEGASQVKGWAFSCSGHQAPVTQAHWWAVAALPMCKHTHNKQVVGGCMENKKMY